MGDFEKSNLAQSNHGKSHNSNGGDVLKTRKADSDGVFDATALTEKNPGGAGISTRLWLAKG
jgi:hypothetical protein